MTAASEMDSVIEGKFVSVFTTKGSVVAPASNAEVVLDRVMYVCTKPGVVVAAGSHNGVAVSLLVGVSHNDVPGYGSFPGEKLRVEPSGRVYDPLLLKQV